MTIRNEATGEMVPTLSKSRLGDTQVQSVPRSIVDKVVQERVAGLEPVTKVLPAHGHPFDDLAGRAADIRPCIGLAGCSVIVAPYADSREKIVGAIAQADAPKEIGAAEAVDDVALSARVKTALMRTPPRPCRRAAS